MKTFYITSVFIIFCCIAACKKSDFLEARPSNALVVPSTLSDFQALLDHDGFMNGANGTGLLPALGEMSGDDYYVTDAQFPALSTYYRNIYVWDKDVLGNENILDWNFPYRAVFYSNAALTGLTSLSVEPSQQAAYNNTKGSALFYRSFMFYQLAEIFAPPYNAATAANEYGIPLRLQSDVNEPLSRATVQQTYDRVIPDLLEAKELLPVTPLYKTRPSKPAVFALLARIHLTMQQYEKAYLYADSCLQLSNTLIDYNTLDQNSTAPFARFNNEVIHASLLQADNATLVSITAAKIDTALLSLYHFNDLRAKLFFRASPSGGLRFKGSYDGSTYLFGGLAVDEVYLIRAECNARLGRRTEALNDLNTLLKNRWKAATFVPVTAATTAGALSEILQHRRKELVMRGLRWSDLRRLNREPQFSKTLIRNVNGQLVTLPPGDPRYTFPIPQNVISFHSGMPQNKR